MSRLGDEYGVVPAPAKLIAALVYAGWLCVMGFLWLGPAVPERPAAGTPAGVGMFVLTAVAGLALAILVLLIGYVNADARRRRMNHVLWTLLAIFIPNAIGIILYFILREPLPTPCPACGEAVVGQLAFCPACGAALRGACPGCRQPVEPGWSHCGRCGRRLAA